MGIRGCPIERYQRPQHHSLTSFDGLCLHADNAAEIMAFNRPEGRWALCGDDLQLESQPGVNEAFAPGF